MTLQKIRIDSDLAPVSLGDAVRQFVEAFGYWPAALISPSYEENQTAGDYAKSLGLGWYVLPQAIMLNDCAWAIVGKDGDTIWSPGA